MVDKESFFRLALDRARDALPVAWSKDKRLQNQQVKRALQQGDAVVVRSLGLPFYPSILLLG